MSRLISDGIGSGRANRNDMIQSEPQRGQQRRVLNVHFEINPAVETDQAVAELDSIGAEDDELHGRDHGHAFRRDGARLDLLAEHEEGRRKADDLVRAVHRVLVYERQFALVCKQFSLLRMVANVRIERIR